MLMSLRFILSNRSSIALFLALTLLRTMPLGASTQSHHFLVALKTLQSAIYDLTGLKLIKALNQWVARRIVNKVVDDPTWDWPNETAVVTGGSSGIGAEIVRELAKRKIKTIILDINKQFQNWVRTF
jgi:FlaA1/EpsC-like NDP-sugar epimerase